MLIINYVLSATQKRLLTVKTPRRNIIALFYPFFGQTLLFTDAIRIPRLRPVLHYFDNRYIMYHVQRKLYVHCTNVYQMPYAMDA